MESFSLPPGHAVKFLATQIPQFSGSEEDDINIWLQKIENVADLHNLSSSVKLTAATTKLSGNTRRWFDLSTGESTRSWTAFREAVSSRFRMRIPHSVLVRKLEARKWIYSSESFQDYATDKMALTQRLNYSDFDTIHSLIEGITHISIQAAAFAIDTQSLDVFLERMQRMTSSCASQLKKFSTSVKTNKFKDSSFKSNKSEDIKESSGSFSPQKKEVFCAYCRNKGHIKSDCFKLKKKDPSTKGQSLSSTVAAVENSVMETEDNLSSSVASVMQDHQIIVRDTQVLDVDELNGSPCKIFASVDSGSPISFIRRSVFDKFFDLSITPLKSSSNLYRAIDQSIIKSPGFVSSSLKLNVLPNTLLSCDFHVLNHESLSTHILLGRDCMKVNKLFFGMDYTKEGNCKDTLDLLSHVASADIIDYDPKVSDFFSDINIDFDSKVKNKLLSILQKIEDAPVPVLEDDYLVKINLKDDSTFAYAPRKFAWSERIQIRDITDDLLKRNIIKYSTSPYCSRVVPVRKKNGSLRLCVDLRPLNSRVIKQKYPFPLIEDCLA